MHNKSKMSRDINLFSLLYVHDPHVRLHLDRVGGGVGAGWRAVKRVERDHILGPGVPQLPQLRLLTCHLLLFIADLPQMQRLLTTVKSLMPYVGKQMMMPSCLSNAFSCDGGSVAGALALTAAHTAIFLKLLSLSRLRGQSRFCTKFRFFDFPFPLRSKGEKGKVPHLRTSVRTAAPCWWEEKHLF